MSFHWAWKMVVFQFSSSLQFISQSDCKGIDFLCAHARVCAKESQPTLGDPRLRYHQPPLPVGFSRQGYCTGGHFLFLLCEPHLNELRFVGDQLGRAPTAFCACGNRSDCGSVPFSLFFLTGKCSALVISPRPFCIRGLSLRVTGALGL